MHNAAKYFELHHMPVNKEVSAMFPTKKITMILKYIVSKMSVAAFVVVVGMVGTAAASRPMVTSTDPADDAVNVAVNTTVTVNFDVPMDCKTISTHTFRLKAVRHMPIAPASVTCSGSSATFTPLNDLAVSTSYKIQFYGKITDTKGKALRDGFESDFTTGPNTRPPATATPTATATGTATATPTSTATSTATATATATATDTATATATSTATATATPTATATSTATDTATATSTATATDTATATATDTATATATATDTATATATATATDTATATATATSTATATATATATPTATATAIAPTVLTSAPAILGCGGQGMGTNQKITVTFSEPMNPASLMAAGTFTVTSPGPTLVPGSVSYDAVNNIAIFAPTGGNFAAGTAFTATVTTAAESAGLLPLANNYVWTFTTGAGPDMTPPLVSSTNPVNTAPSVGTNQKIVATFDKGIDSTTLTGTTFTVTEKVGLLNVAVPGTVTYSTIGTTATFTPTSALDANAVFTATVTTGVKDLAGNALAASFVWTFTTGATTDTVAPTVTSTNPIASASGVGIDAAVNATFDKAMDPSTINPTTFTVTGPGATVVVGKVSYDVLDKIATFTPTSPLASSTTFTVIIAGAKDLAGNALVTTTWTFFTGVAPTGQSPVNLGQASSYDILATTTVTSPTATVVNGDLGVFPGTAITGFPPSTVNGTINLDNPASQAAEADLLTAFDYLMNTVPPGVTVAGNIGGTSPIPGVYTAASTLAVTSGNLTLDAMGDPNAIWIFQIGTALDVTTSVILANGAQASNVFWQVGSSATIDVGAVMQGNILAGISITLNGGATMNGRALALNGAVTASAASSGVPVCQ
jgi:hypothetical protein